jgi:hypothetical protein
MDWPHVAKELLYQEVIERKIKAAERGGRSHKQLMNGLRRGKVTGNLKTKN